MSEFQHIKGGKELNDFLQQLPVKMEKNILRGAMRAGAKPVRDEVRLNIHSVSGELSRGVKISTQSKGGRVIARIRMTGPHAFVARWLEFTGAAPHIIEHMVTSGALALEGGVFDLVHHPGFQPKPFLRPALDREAQSAVNASASYIKTRLTKQGIDTADVEIDEP